MKKTPLKRKTPLRKCRLNAKGKPRERFEKLRDEGLRMLVRAQGCVVLTRSLNPSPCGYYLGRMRDEACHLKPKARGKGDQGNLFCACPRHHDEQEGRTAAFEAKYGLDLTAITEENPNLARPESGRYRGTALNGVSVGDCGRRHE